MVAANGDFMSAHTILIIDDEEHIVDVVEYVLQENGFHVLSALDGDKGLQSFLDDEPDLILLDLNLPGIAGLDLFREIRRRKEEQPIIMLTSRSDEVDRVVGLELGADDYVTKPFSPRELAARVRAVLRRSGSGRNETANSLRFGPLSLDCDGYSLKYFNQPLVLSRPEFLLVECLVRYPARVFTRDTLIDHMYDGEHIVTDRSVDAHIKRLRRKFAGINSEHDPIETVHGLGYKLSQAIEGL